MRTEGVAIVKAVLAVLAVLALLAGGARAQEEGEEVARPFKVLALTKTTGFRHKSIPLAVQFFEAASETTGFKLKVTDSTELFDSIKTLRRFDVVVFLLTTGDVLNEVQQEVFRKYIRRGKGFMGVHSATDTEKNWSFFNRVLGARFANHPPRQEATLRLEGTHVSTSHMVQGSVEDTSFQRRDEWYNFDANPRLKGSNVVVLVDESSYSGGEMGDDHPITWYRTVGKKKARVWYTAMGHTDESYTTDELFKEHLVRGLVWAAGRDDQR